MSRLFLTFHPDLPSDFFSSSLLAKVVVVSGRVFREIDYIAILALLKLFFSTDMRLSPNFTFQR